MALQPLSELQYRDAQLSEEIRRIHRDDPEFGYCFIADELHAKRMSVSERKVWKLRPGGIFSQILRPKSKTKKADPAVGDDLLQRHFHAECLNAAWVVDITEHWTGTGKVYVCGLKDLCPRRIVGWAIGGRMTSRLAVESLDDAMRKRHYPQGVIVHSDRGRQFRIRRFQSALASYGALRSMGRAGVCGDNTAMESFFTLLQKNVLDRQSWESRQELSAAIMHWIDRIYHRKRLQRALGRLTPIEYETIMKHATPIAA